MKLCVGPVPADGELAPGEWQALREPGPLGAQWMALPLGFMLGGLVLLAWLSRVPFYEMERVGIGWFWAALAAIIPAHELLHILAHPGCGRKSVVGIWPRKLICYAVHQGPVSRARFTVILFAPLAVLTLLPLAWTLITGHAAMLTMFVSVVNGFGSYLDLFGVLLVWSQTSRGTLICNRGWWTYWRKPDGG